ncbi:MAG: DUF1080 domain-containing protein [Planctomycetaceae bacterium]|nr:DUF1080 domain-containing protein [Planctomycetaceae bacterium]
MRAAILCLSLVALTAAVRVTADDSKAAPAEGEWQTLFDGKTLTNWKPTEFGGEGEVYVEDGALVMDMGNPMTGVTWTGKPLPKSNYEVEFEGRRVTGSDFFCALTFPVQDDYASLVLGGWGGTIVGISTIDGYDASENETTDFFKFNRKEWYKIRLKVTNEKIESWINDKQLADVELGKKEIDVRIEVEPSKPFGLASFETQGQIRNLRLRSVKE